MIDKEALYIHFDHDQEMIDELVVVFEETFPEVLLNLETAIKEIDFANIELHAHTLKGMIANFFAADLKEMAFKLELAGREKNDEDLSHYFVKLSEGLPLLIKELKQNG